MLQAHFQRLDAMPIRPEQTPFLLMGRVQVSSSSERLQRVQPNLSSSSLGRGGRGVAGALSRK